MPIAGRLTDRFGGGRVALCGVSILCLSTIPLAFVGVGTSILLISLVLLVRGVGIGFSFMPAMTAAFASLRPDQLSDATPQLNVCSASAGRSARPCWRSCCSAPAAARTTRARSPRRSTRPTGGRSASRCCR